MRTETVKSYVPSFRMPGVGGGPEEPATSDIVDRLARAGSDYNAETAFIMSIASAWSYAENHVLSDMMERFGIPNECTSISISNDALFLTATARLLRSKDGRLAILCFRGTEPTNLINWLLNASTEKDPFGTIGYLHGGFYRNVLALWPHILCWITRTIEDVRPCPDRAPPPCARDEPPPTKEDCPKKPLEALYITGHSLGGAMAAIAAALCFGRDSEPGAPNIYGRIRAKLRGIYTFGQPMIGDKAVAEWGRETFGSKLFTHRYRVDIAPRMLPRTMGLRVDALRLDAELGAVTPGVHLANQQRSRRRGLDQPSSTVSQQRQAPVLLGRPLAAQLHTDISDHSRRRGVPVKTIGRGSHWKWGRTREIAGNGLHQHRRHRGSRALRRLEPGLSSRRNHDSSSRERTTSPSSVLPSASI